MLKDLLIKSDFISPKKELGVQNVNFEKKFIFIHIPKNAGTSVNEALGIQKGGHFYASEYRAALGWRYRLFFSFCFVRNPWSRFLSLYNYARLEESYYHSSINPEKALHGKHLDYDILQHASLNDCSHLLLEGKLRHDNRWNHWQPQVKWVCDRNGKIMVDFVGRMENVDRDFEYIGKKIGMSLKLPKVNLSNTEKDYRAFFDDETRKNIARYYEQDILKFGYSF